MDLIINFARWAVYQDFADAAEWRFCEDRGRPKTLFTRRWTRHVAFPTSSSVGVVPARDFKSHEIATIQQKISQLKIIAVVEYCSHST